LGIPPVVSVQADVINVIITRIIKQKAVIIFWYVLPVYAKDPIYICCPDLSENIVNAAVKRDVFIFSYFFASPGIPVSVWLMGKAQEYRLLYTLKPQGKLSYIAVKFTRD